MVDLADITVYVAGRAIHPYSILYRIKICNVMVGIRSCVQLDEVREAHSLYIILYI